MATACKCSACTRKPREPGTAFGTDAHGEWRQLNTYYPQFFEERWQHWIQRERERKERTDAQSFNPV